jgi:glycosyltransferase involved in cell wall biosynthesis
VRAIFGLAAILRQSKPVILHSYLVHANFLARATRLLYPVPILISSMRTIREERRWREAIYRLTDPLCDLTTQNSRQGAERYVKIKAVPASKMWVIPNGVDARCFRPDPDLRANAREVLQLEGRFVWLAIGRLEPAKDYPNLARAFASIAAQCPESILLIAGDGSLRSELEALVTAQGLGERISFLGVRSDIPALMNAADAYVMASAREGTPTALLEAAATGLPVVATSVGGIPDVVLDQESGFLVPPRDHVSLANKMIAVMELSEAARRRMGRHGRAHVKANYGWEQIVGQWEAVYTGLLERKNVL